MAYRKITGIVIFALLLCASIMAKGEGKPAASAEEITPLKVGEKAPQVKLKTSEGEDFDLSASLAEQPTILVFYRGSW